MYISLNIKYLRQLKNISQEHLAKEIGSLRSSFSQYESGKTEPPLSICIKICTFFNIDLDSFIKKDLSLENIVIKNEKIIEKDVLFISNNTNNVKMYDIDAFASIVTSNQMAETVVEEFYLPNLVGSHVALRVKGNSMEVTLFDGDVIIAKECSSLAEISHNGIYLIVYDDTPIIKRIKIGSDQVILHSDNILHAPIIAEIDKFKKVFRVVRLLRLYK